MTETTVKERYYLDAIKGRALFKFTGYVRTDDGKWEYPDFPTPEAHSYGDFTEDKTKEIDEEIHFIEVPYATGSDYSGSLVERANFKALREYAEENDLLNETVFEVNGGHGTFGLYISLKCQDPEIWEMIKSLDSYPLLDEELESEMEIEAIDENWDSWAAYDFRRELEKQFKWESLDRHTGFCNKYQGISTRAHRDVRRYQNALLDKYGLDRDAISPKERTILSDLLSRSSKLTMRQVRECNKRCKTLEVAAENDENLRTLFEALREKANVYWENETGDSMHVDVTRVANEAGKHPELMKKWVLKDGEMSFNQIGQVFWPNLYTI